MIRRWWSVLALVVAAAGAAAGAESPSASNTCRLAVQGAGGSPALDLEITYISEPLMTVLFGSDETRAQVRAAAAGNLAFLVRASARRAADFYPTSFVFSQGNERIEVDRGAVVALDGSFGGRLSAGESARGLLILPGRLDLSRPLSIEYASTSQNFRFPSTEPLEGPVRAEGLKVDRVQSLEWKVQDLERRLKALEEKSQKSSP